nr:60S ribosomal protein L5 [Cryptomonas sp.]
MFHLKILKNKSYHSRFQVKWRRRREGKTDYRSRKKMICQDKRKYNSPKFRVVIRISKRNIICQFVHSRIEGDRVIDAVYSKKLKDIGIPFGFTNFPSAYTCGLFLAKRVLAKKKLNNKNYCSYNELTSITLNAVLDIGLTRVTTGHKVFAAMKGALDGGIVIPHNEKRYPGYDSEKGFNSQLLCSRTKGEHIHSYMVNLKEEDELKFNRFFSCSLKCDISPQKYSDLYNSLISRLLKNSFPLFQ